MHDRAYRHRLRDRINTEIADCHVAHQRQALIDFLFTKMPQIQQHAVAVFCRQHVALLLLVPERLTHSITWPEFHGFQLRFADRCFRPHAIVLQKTAAVFVQQNAALAATGLGQQRAGIGKPGRVVLHELHVLQRNTGAIGERHAVTGFDCAVGREWKHPSRATTGDDDRARLKLAHLSATHFNCGKSLTTTVIHNQVGGIKLIEAANRRKLKRSLKQGVQNMKT